MSLSLLHRRALLQSGVTVAGCLALAGLRPVTALGAPRVSSVPVTGNVIGWLVIGRAGGGELTIVQIDLLGHPERLIETITVPALTSVAAFARHAHAATVKAIATSWQMPATECVSQSGRIECSRLGRSVRFALWTDFV